MFSWTLPSPNNPVVVIASTTGSGKLQEPKLWKVTLPFQYSCLSKMLEAPPLHFCSVLHLLGPGCRHSGKGIQGNCSLRKAFIGKCGEGLDSRLCGTRCPVVNESEEKASGEEEKETAVNWN